MSEISVIIPTYNRRHLITATLDNILGQSMKAGEIIVVDDGSDDGTLELLEKQFSDKIILVSNKGKGPGAARNTGLAIAQGKYIKFFDSDDLMTGNMLESQYQALHQSQKGVVYSPYFFARHDPGKSWYSEEDLILNYFPLRGKRPLWHYMMVDGLFITIPGMLFKRDFLEEVGPWREDVVAYEDWDYLFRISLKEPQPLHTNEAAFLYHLHGAQTTEVHYSNQERDHDKRKVLRDLYQSIVQPDPRFSYWERLMFRNKFYQLYRAIPPGHDLRDELGSYDTVLQRMAWLYLRIKLKLGRVQTGTAWQPCHGPLKSEEQLYRYFSLLS